MYIHVNSLSCPEKQVQNVNFLDEPKPPSSVTFVGQNAQDLTIQWVPGDNQTSFYDVKYRPAPAYVAFYM